MSIPYQDPGPTSEDVRATRGPVLLEFGAPWCGICLSLASSVEAALQDYPNVQHFKVEDGPGRPLGRSFGVKLWPTFIFLKDGNEIARSVRPQDRGEIREGLQRITV